MSDCYGKSWRFILLILGIDWMARAESADGWEAIISTVLGVLFLALFFFDGADD